MKLSQQTPVRTANNTLVAILTALQRYLYYFTRLTVFYVKQGIEDCLEVGFFSTKCSSTARLDGKTAVITGCNTGIGKVTAENFFRRGARVIMACRNLEAANEALMEIERESAKLKNCGELLVTQLDLSSLESVRTCAEHLIKTERRINLLINNAGVMLCSFSKTEDGFEIQFGTNHLGHFLFTLLLLPRIIESKPSRIVNVSSMAHTGGKIDFDDINWENKPYNSLIAYEQSKLANVLFTKELAKRLKENNIDGVNTYALHPGVIATDLGRHLDSVIPGLKWIWDKIVRIFIKTPEQGAQTTIYCAVSEECEHETGLYYSQCKIKKPSSRAQDEETARRLWEKSCDLVKLDINYDPFKNVH